MVGSATLASISSVIQACTFPRSSTSSQRHCLGLCQMADAVVYSVIGLREITHITQKLLSEPGKVLSGVRNSHC